MWWKIYFWVYLFLFVVGCFALLQYAPLGLGDVIGIIFNTLLMLGIYSYVFKKKIMAGKYWNITFWVLTLIFVLNFAELYVLPEGFLSDMLPFIKSNIEIDAGSGLFSLLVSTPALYGIHKLSLNQSRK